jgi:hypothetical protein
MTTAEALRRAADAFLQAGVDLEGCRLNYVQHGEPGDAIIATVGVWTRPPAVHRLVALAVMHADGFVQVLGTPDGGQEDTAA